MCKPRGIGEGDVNFNINILDVWKIKKQKGVGR